MIDIGVNFSNKKYECTNDVLISKARQAGVNIMIATGTSIDVSGDAICLAQRFSGTVFATAGVHPHHAKTLGPVQATKLQQLIYTTCVVAVGETGLDYDRNFSTPVEQRAAFALQAGIAKECGKPLFLHEREASSDFVSILRDVFGAGPIRGVVHCFTGTAAEAEIYLSLGLDIGITGWISDDRRNASLLDALKIIPLDRLHLETDAPYLMPFVNGKRIDRSNCNVPANLPHVANALAAALGRDAEEVASACAHNSRNLFQLNNK